ncbi:hypothetical protein NDU88_005633 [Pleurodeles waltl]|uniref:Uncharacterized protein n=1 Tax=Pleurodeles waltl TaxID=8319 RepID=A0AAV7N4Y9_PLEWA|nr:hypothetical protein NDU88_005633 [Pleurodeles waltl]
MRKLFRLFLFSKSTNLFLKEGDLRLKKRDYINSISESGMPTERRSRNRQWPFDEDESTTHEVNSNNKLTLILIPRNSVYSLHFWRRGQQALFWIHRTRMGMPVFVKRVHHASSVFGKAFK